MFENIDLSTSKQNSFEIKQLSRAGVNKLKTIYQMTLHDLFKNVRPNKYGYTLNWNIITCRNITYVCDSSAIVRST